jgi:hypothetical protein
MTFKPTKIVCKVNTTKKEHECTMASERIKAQCIYAAVVDAGQIYPDQTGIFPVISSRGNVSIMVLYE